MHRAAVRTDTPLSERAARLAALEAAVRARSTLVPRLAIVLGSGLGPLADMVTDRVEIPFTDLPGWPRTSVSGHAGSLVLGRLDDVPVLCLRGRFHLYEGLTAWLVAEPVILSSRLGASTILLTNASGGLRDDLAPGTLMVINDHINLTGQSPLLGENDAQIGPRFPDLVEAWDERLRTLLHEAAAAEQTTLAEGVYAGVLGPAFETPAEVRMLRSLGADAVGMSTVLEAIAARWAGLQLCGLSLITNHAAGVTGDALTHEEVLSAAEQAAPQFHRVVRRFVRLFAEAA